MPSPKALIAIAQLCSTSCKPSNLASITRLAALASKNNASFLFLPECFAFMGSSPKETLDNAELVPDVGTTFKVKDDKTMIYALQKLAIENNLWVSGGGIHEISAPSFDDDSGESRSQSKRVWNTHVIIDNLGSIRGKYRKIHLFDITLPTLTLKESTTTCPGTQYTVVKDTPIGNIGLGTCYDMRFGYMADALVKGGAEVLLFPAAFTVPTGKAHWHVLLRGRSISSQVYTIASAQFGQHNAKRTSYGHALCVDPWGGVVGDCDGYSSSVFDDDKEKEETKEEKVKEMKEKAIFCEVDVEKVREARRNMPLVQHERREGIGLDIV